jgi:galactonate dehydratase
MWAASLQLDACIPNLLCQEQVSLGDGYLVEPFVLRDGYINVPTKPGLGIELDYAAVQEKLYEGSWDAPRWFFEDDGSSGEW